MKKVITFILISIFMLTACNQKPFVSTNAQKYQYFIFDNIDWGMSKYECMKQLKVKEKNLLSIEEKFETEDQNGFKVEKEIYGYPAQLTCMFASKLGEFEGDLGLISVFIEFEKDKYDLTKIFHQWAQGVDYSGFEEEKLPQDTIYTNSQYSVTSIADIKDSVVKDKAVEILKQILPTTKRTVIDGAKLVTSHFRHDPDQGALIQFDGSSAAVLNYAIKSK